MKTHFLAQYYLYAKGHYLRFTHGGLWEDLKRIHTATYGHHGEYATKNDVIFTLVNEVEKNPRFNLITFISDISPHGSWQIWKENTNVFEEWDYETAVASKCLSIMALTSVMKMGSDTEPIKKIMELGKPDENILPLTNPEQWI